LSKYEIDLSSLILWIICSTFLLLVQFGLISPVGIIIISLDQYTWIFWISAFAFTLSSIYLVYRIPRYARWSLGYTGEIVRTVKYSKSGRDYFVRGKDDTLLKDVLHKNWPFKERNQSDKWYAVDAFGNDVTDQPLGSLDGTVTIRFLEEE
jgi:hypothetical protein